MDTEVSQRRWNRMVFAVKPWCSLTPRGFLECKPYCRSFSPRSCRSSCFRSRPGSLHSSSRSGASSRTSFIASASTASRTYPPPAPCSSSATTSAISTGCSLWAACPRRITFVLWSGTYRHRVPRLFLGWARHNTISIDNRTARPHDLEKSMRSHRGRARRRPRCGAVPGRPADAFRKHAAVRPRHRARLEA